MAISQFPAAAAAGGAEDVAFASKVPLVMKTYEHDVELDAGVYDVAVSLSTEAHIVFLSDSAVILTLTTSGGVASGQLDTAATKLFITTRTGGTADAIVKLTKTAAIINPSDVGAGTLDTINTTGTYNQTGYLSILAFGGGAAGEKGGSQYSSGGAGGASGAVVFGSVVSNTAQTVTVGAKGTAATSNNTNIVAPTNSSFGNLLTATNNFFYIAGGGRGYNDVEAGTVDACQGAASRAFLSFNSNSTTGGGGGGRGNRTNQNGGVGAGSGIGTGGTGGPSNGGDSPNNANPSTKGTAGTGKASGGGGGAATGSSFPNAAGRFGGDGADGVVYILRGF
jgi:hypothetical protein